MRNIFGTNGITIFQGLKSSVTIHLMQDNAQFVTSVQYITHRTNLVVQTLNGLNLVKKLNWAAFSMYNYFVHNPKHHLEVSKLIKLLEYKGNKFLKNITT